jgi:hypothetical protein
LIFNFPKLSIITKLLLIIIICSDFYCGFSEDHPFYATTVAQNLKLPKDQSFSKQIDHFLHCLKKATKDECVQIFGKYNMIISRELDYNKLYFISYEEVADLLDQAASESIDSLTLFTLPPLQDQKNFAIVFNEELLEKVQKNYNFHALFNISAQSLEDSSVVKMKFLVIGQRKLIVGYSRNAKIKHPDYDFATGKYDYRELFTMETRKDSKGTLGLFNIKGRSHPNGKPQWMKGPLNVDIQSLIITSDPKGQKKILIQYDLFGIKQKLIDPISIEKLNIE